MADLLKVLRGKYLDADCAERKKEMPNSKELYPEYADEDCCSPDSYQPIIDAFGEVLLQVDDDGYQGDSRVLYVSGSQYGYLQFGWGSCSGCDALQAVNSHTELQSLIDELECSIKWFDSAKDALDFFVNHDWQGDYDWGEIQQNFVRQATELLKQSSGHC